MTRNPSQVRIDRVTTVEPLAEAVRELSLDRPVAGSQWRGPSIEVSGWVLGRRSPLVNITVLHDGRPIRTIPVRPQGVEPIRRSAGAAGTENPGFTAMVSTLGLPEELRLDVAAEFGDGRRVTVAHLEGRRTPVRLDFEPTLQPVMVTSLGRMGSTRLMSLLAAHPRIVTLRKHPYECKTAKYWLQVLATLTEPAMQDSNPYFLPDLIREPKPGIGLFADRMAEVCQKNVDGWYSELAFHQVKENVRYFAEKMTPDRLPPLMRELYPGAKEVLLVRDPRDWIGSILAGGGESGVHGFGRRENEPAVDCVRRHAELASELRAYWQAHRGVTHLVRYEDLVREPAPTLRTLFDHLEIDATPSCVDATLREAQTESASFQHHTISSHAGGSVGRWRDELTPELRAVAREAFADVLRSFDYDGEPSVEHAVTEAIGEVGECAAPGVEGGGNG